MRVFTINLLIAAMLVMPLHIWAFQMQCDCDFTHQDASSKSATESCCPSPVGEGDEQSKHQPCDDQNCPSDCCSLSIGSAYVLPFAPKLVTTLFELCSSPRIVHSECTSPHLRRLKRPPKSA